MILAERAADGRLIDPSCDGCGSPEVLPYPHRGADPEQVPWLCVQCADVYQRTDLALDHFVAMFGPLFQEWVEHWQARGLRPSEIDEQASVGIAKLLREAGVDEQAREWGRELWSEAGKRSETLPSRGFRTGRDAEHDEGGEHVTRNNKGEMKVTVHVIPATPAEARAALAVFDRIGKKQAAEDAAKKAEESNGHHRSR